MNGLTLLDRNQADGGILWVRSCGVAHREEMDVMLCMLFCFSTLMDIEATNGLQTTETAVDTTDQRSAIGAVKNEKVVFPPSDKAL